MKIEAKEWYYDHSCGCCSDWGVTLVIDGKAVEDRTFSGTEDAYKYVLEEILISIFCTRKSKVFNRFTINHQSYTPI